MKMNKKITDQFKIGDKVEWVRIKVLPLKYKYHPLGQYEVLRYMGEIKEIKGSRAAIEMPYGTLVEVSLFELKVIQ